MAESKMAEFKMAQYKMAAIIIVKWEWMSLSHIELVWSQSFVQNGWIEDGRIQDGCHHQVDQIELVWVRVRVEGECVWVILREDNMVSELNMAEFKMAAIIKLSEND